MIEGGNAIDQFEEMYIYAEWISVVGISDFPRGLKYGSWKGEGYFGLANTLVYFLGKKVSWIGNFL